MTQNTHSYPLKRWLHYRLTRARRDAIDDLAKKLIAESQLPARGSYGLYIAHLRRLEYSEDDRKLFDVLWQEMVASQS